MSREIKFRVWDKTLQKYVRHYKWGNLPADKRLLHEAPDHVQNFLQTDILPASHEVGFKDSEIDWQNIVPEQYTGLKDKNGKEIYEGDIIEWEHGTLKRSVVQWISEADEFDYTGWQIQSLLSQWGDIKVIGNIHENEDSLNEEN